MIIESNINILNEPNQSSASRVQPYFDHFINLSIKDRKINSTNCSNSVNCKRYFQQFYLFKRFFYLCTVKSTINQINMKDLTINAKSLIEDENKLILKKQKSAYTNGQSDDR